MIDRAFGAEQASEIARASVPHVRVRHVLLAPSERIELADLLAKDFDSYLVKPVRTASLAARLLAPESAPSLAHDLEVNAAHEPAPMRRTLSVLVAEDNEINALLAQAILAKLGHVPTVVADGIAAVNAVSTAHAIGAPYELVLMDLHLPGMDGLEATRRIRALGEEGGRVPIIALTANAFAEDREACREAGMDAFVVKPVDRERLEEAIAAVRLARPASAIGHAA